MVDVKNAINKITNGKIKNPLGVESKITKGNIGNPLTMKPKVQDSVKETSTKTINKILGK